MKRERPSNNWDFIQIHVGGVVMLGCHFTIYSKNVPLLFVRKSIQKKLYRF